MKNLKHLLLSLLTTFLCVLLSGFYNSPIFLTTAFTTSKILSSPVVATKPAVNQTQILSLVRQSQALYEEGQFVEAVQILKKAADEFKATNDALNEAIALTNLSLAYQQLGQWQKANEVISQTIQLLQNLQNSDSSQEQASAGGAVLTQVFAQALDVRGGLELAQGQTEVALSTWQSAAKIYQHLDDISALIRNHINQAQAMQALGNYLQADQTLTLVRENLQKQPDSAVKARGLYSLGNVLRSLGYLSGSHKILEESYSVAGKVGSAMDQSNTLLSLGNTARAQASAQLSLGNSSSAKDYTKTAIQYYQQAALIASATPTVRLQAQLNLLTRISHK